MRNQGEVRVRYEIEPAACRYDPTHKNPCDTPAVFETVLGDPICYRHATRCGFSPRELRLIGHEMTLDQLTVAEGAP